jgi:amidase
LFEEGDAVGMAAAVRAREVTPRELLDEAIRRAERVNPQLNALTERRYEAARNEAEHIALDAPFAGVPFIVKDLGPQLAGMPFRMGSRYFQDYVPAGDHELIRRMKAAGLCIFAKSATPEFGLTPYTEPLAYGPCRNPWNLERTPGGSSGGSAALCAAGVVPLAHGNDGGGSIRIPASCTGLFGVKPSRDRVPVTPGLIGNWNVDLGVSRSVRDSAALLDVLRSDDGPRFLDEAEREPGRLRIAVIRGPMLGHGISAQSRTAVDRAVALCESLGHTVVEDEPSGIDYSATAYATLMLFTSQVGFALGAGNPTPQKPLTRADVEPATYALLTIARLAPLDELTTALTTQQRLIVAMAAFMQNYDAVLTPTLAAPPLRIGELALSKAELMQIAVLTRVKSRGLILKAAREIASKLFDWLPHTPIFNLSGQPAMSVPLHWTDDGLPVGVQFGARHGDEATLYRLAAQLERAQPWSARRPPVWSGGG